MQLAESSSGGGWPYRLWLYPNSGAGNHFVSVQELSENILIKTIL